jgi:flagellar basal-body rod protein FlgC
MGLFDGYNIAASGMSAQRTRVNVISSNIANAKTTHTEDGGPYKKKNVVFQEILLDSQKQNKINIQSNFSSSPNDLKLMQTNSSHQNGLVDLGSKVSNNNSRSAISSVSISEVKEADKSVVMRYEPEHPDANKDGYVAYPNINPVVEMVDLIEAMRSYEANVNAFTTQKTIDNKTLDILRG